MLKRLRARQEWGFGRALWRASPAHAVVWLALIVVRGALPAVVSVAFGSLVASISRGGSHTGPLVVLGVAFAASLIVYPLHLVVGSNAGSRLAAHLYDRLTAVCVAPEGIGHLERAELANDLVMARDFDQGTMGPPLDISMDFIAGGLVQLVAGFAAAIVLFGLGWWQPIVLVAAWGSTHWLLRESGVWKDRNTSEVRSAQRHAEYAYRLAVDASPAKELRLFGLAGWVIERFIATRTHLYQLQYEATRLREKSVLTCLAVVFGGNLVVFWSIAGGARGDLGNGAAVTAVQAAIGVGAIAFGGLNWALDLACAPVAALARLEAAMPLAGTLAGTPPVTLPRIPVGTLAGTPPSVLPAAFVGPGDASAFGVSGAGQSAAPEIRFVGVGFAYPDTNGQPGIRRVLDGFDLTIPAGSSMAIVGANGAGKTTIAKLLCRLYDPVDGLIEIDGAPLTALDVRSWRERLTAVFQDYIRFELPLRANVAPRGAPDSLVTDALARAGATGLADGNLDTVLSKAYPGGTDLSGGQWQRVALARALAAVDQGAQVVLLDEPTAQLDVRGEAEIFERILTATRGCTTILISHRFSTVRLADRICVLDAGGVVELGSHDELIALGGRYRTMFDLQASRFAEYDESGQEVVHDTL